MIAHYGKRTKQTVRVSTIHLARSEHRVFIGLNTIQLSFDVPSSNFESRNQMQINVIIQSATHKLVHVSTQDLRNSTIILGHFWVCVWDSSSCTSQIVVGA